MQTDSSIITERALRVVTCGNLMGASWMLRDGDLSGIAVVRETTRISGHMMPPGHLAKMDRIVRGIPTVAMAIDLTELTSALATYWRIKPEVDAWEDMMLTGEEDLEIMWRN